MTDPEPTNVHCTTGDPADRREFLRRAGIGGVVAGAAWAAPAILSLDAAHAVGTCGVGTTTFAWSSGGNNTRHTDTTSPLVGTTSAGIDIVVTNTNSSGVPGSGLYGNNWKTRSSSIGAINCGSAATTDYPMGNQNSFYTLQMQAANNTNCTSGTFTADRWVSVTFGFFNTGTSTPHAVRGLSLSLLDIDSSGTYRDRAEVRINGSATPASTGAGGVFTVSTIATGNSYTQPNAALARFEADNPSQSVAASGTEGNVTLTSNATTDITTFTVFFQNMGTPSSIQWIGIGDLTFCKV